MVQPRIPRKPSLTFSTFSTFSTDNLFVEQPCTQKGEEKINLYVYFGEIQLQFWNNDFKMIKIGRIFLGTPKTYYILFMSYLKGGGAS